MKDDIKPIGHVVIAGGTGFIGTNLAGHLADLGCEVVLLSRHVPEALGPGGLSEKVAAFYKYYPKYIYY